MVWLLEKNWHFFYLIDICIVWLTGEQPDGDPNDLCRKDLFNKDGPCNPERQAKCNARKDEWIKCIDTITQKENVKLKEEFEDDDEAIRELPGDKLVNLFLQWTIGSNSKWENSILTKPIVKDCKKIQRYLLKISTLGRFIPSGRPIYF